MWWLCIRSFALHIIIAWENTQSTHGFSLLNFGELLFIDINSFRGIFTNFQLFIYLFRLPFEINTTLRCIIMAIVQLFIFFFTMITTFTVLSFFSGVIFYIEAILIDIKSIFNRIDKLLKSKEKKTKTQLSILDYCKEAIILHARVYRHFSF